VRYIISIGKTLNTLTKNAFILELYSFWNRASIFDEWSTYDLRSYSYGHRSTLSVRPCLDA
jgi:hypothetical protein